jgi:sulfatase maturation enzyme AslB (radical SAM superfamily)
MIKKEEFHVITTNIHNEQYQYFTEIFDDLASALEYAEPYCLRPVQFSIESDFESSVAIEAREVLEDEDGDVIEDTFIEHIDPFQGLGLSETDILDKANGELI